MPIVLYRIDDRLIHGQVVVGWGQPLDIRLLILLDDLVAGSEWEQELYRMAVPPEMEIRFDSLATIAGNHPKYLSDPRRSILITGDVNTMRQLACKVPEWAAAKMFYPWIIEPLPLIAAINRKFPP